MIFVAGYGQYCNLRFEMPITTENINFPNIA